MDSSPSQRTGLKSLANSSVLHAVLILALGLLAYSNTFNAPLQWDEEYYIVENPVVRDISYFLEPSRAQDIAPGLFVSFKRRYVAYLTFALNYRLHGSEVTGYHVVNFAMHFLNALLLYSLVLLVFRSPRAGPDSLRRDSTYLALFAGLLFIAHPVQTEAVTYVFQRIASLAAFFYLLSLVSYAKARNSEEASPGNKHLGFYALSFVAAVLAMKTKENAFTLPVAIALYEFCFHRDTARGRALRLTPLFLTMLIIPLTLVNIDRPAGEVMADVKSLGHGGWSRWEYLLTQFRVVVTYLRLLFLPVNQNIDYDYPLFKSFFDPQVLLSFLFLASILGVALYFIFRPRGSRAFERRTAAFGMVFFFLALSVESSIIPIPMLINEYRVYLPSAGFFIAASVGVFLLLRNVRRRVLRTTAALLVAALPVLLCFATYQRNAVWGSEITLWKDVVEKSPQKERGHVNLCMEYNKIGEVDNAIRHCRTALSLPQGGGRPQAHNNLGLAYLEKGMLDEAIEQFHAALLVKPETAEYHNNLGFAYMRKKLLQKAVDEFKAAIRLDPDYIDAHYNLGTIYSDMGLLERAMGQYLTALRMDPGFAKAHNNLGIVYARMGMPDRAIEHFEAALGMDPSDPRTYHNLANAYEMKGMPGKAREYRRRGEAVRREGSPRTQ
jgi:tetratricopeptide (TPR) repeat protein